MDKDQTGLIEKEEVMAFTNQIAMNSGQKDDLENSTLNEGNKDTND